ncbi:MAG: ABC transporter substrate-binding protein [Dehalococcoidia bacterium]|nr:ABC transporter substrate-binding protein [Dehalococcoidia bacterium]
MRAVNLRMAVLLALVTMLVTAACGGGDEEATTAPATRAPAATMAPQATQAPTAVPTARPTNTPVPPPTATAVPQPRGTFQFGLPDMSNYQGIYYVTGSPHLYQDAFYDPVIGTNATNKDDPARGIVSSWQLDTTGTVWTFKTRDGIKFHNGNVATAADVAGTILTVRDSKDIIIASQGPMKREVKDVTSPDNNTVVLTLTSRNAFWPFVYMAVGGCGGSPCFLWDMKHLNQVGAGGYNRQPIGSGPYKVVNIQPGQSITLEATENHWFWGTPRVKTLVYNGIPEDGTRTAALRTNQIQLATLSRSDAVAVKNDTNLRIISRVGGTINYRMEQEWVAEYPGYGKNPLSDVRVRQALQFYAIDRDTLANRFMKGFATPSVDWPANQGDPSYKKHPVPAYDPAKAKQMLADAGFPRGFELDMYVWVPPTQPELPEIFEAMAQNWEAIGLKITRKPMPQATWSASISIPRKYEKPSVAGMFSLGLYRFGANQGSTAFDKTSQFQMSDDQVLGQKVRDWLGVANLEEYIKAGQVVSPLLTEAVVATPAVLDYTALWGVRNDPTVVPVWFQVTRDNIALGLFRVGVNEKAGY